MTTFSLPLRATEELALGVKFSFLLRHRVAVASTRGALRPLGLLVTWPGVVLAPSSAVGVAAHGRGDSNVAVCAGCEDCVAHLCAMPWVWLCRREGGGGGLHCLALVVVGGTCPVTALVRVLLSLYELNYFSTGIYRGEIRHLVYQ